jgi:hypothetical protein
LGRYKTWVEEKTKVMLAAVWWRLPVAALAPFPLEGLWIYLTHGINASGISGYLLTGLIFGTCLLPGIIVLATLPFRLWVRIVLELIYIPILLFAMVFFGFGFVGTVYNEWL